MDLTSNLLGGFGADGWTKGLEEEGRGLFVVWFVVAEAGRGVVVWRQKGCRRLGIQGLS